ncbi:hypothetical protein FCM35_KLT10345 [Carex littledalei]|uniref:Wall-associated receptor kinase galacturonan-binding domain-containing protein n=1 Tax=Carex littledalei TaxID=544730 RepID=A0A833VIQ4_9POAL|nr:hypothetical protein FCM35_KLT10345 [Carex littledalei]
MKFLNLLIILFLFYKLGGSSSSSCEELYNITYPYFPPANCWGNAKAIELQCDGNNTVLYHVPTKYLVEDISIENKTFRLVDPDMAVGGCHLPKHPLSWDGYFGCIDNSSVMNFSPNSSLIYFFNCTEEVENSMYKQIHCMDGPHSRVYAAYNSYDAGSIPKSCRYEGSTLGDSLVEDRWKDIDGVKLMEMLRCGFVVSWTMTEFRQDWNMSNSQIVKYCWNNTKR